jgi:hypothetical protein
MGRRPDLSKREVWERRLREFERDEESVAAFCDRVGVSVTTFYRWQRTLSASARFCTLAARSGGSSSPRTRVEPGQLSSRRAATRKTTERRVGPCEGEPALRMSFVPVEITPPPAVISAPQAENGEPAETTCAMTLAVSSTHVEVLLPGGVRLLVPCADPAVIRTVIAALVEGRGEERAC